MTRTDIPDEVVAAMRAAAGGAPPYHGDLAAVRRRGRARRRRRVAAAGGLAAVAVAAAAGASMIVSGSTAHPPVVAPPLVAEPPASAASAAPAEPAQRLLLEGAGWVAVPSDDGEQLTGPELGETAREAYGRLRDVPGAVGVLSSFAELRPDGEVVELDLDLPGIDSIRELVAMPDGRLAAIGIVDRMPGVAREDGPCVEGVDFPLLVIEADGSVSLSREVRVRCEQLRLLAADAHTAYLARDSRLVAHDLATGEERTLIESAEVLAVGNASVAGGRVATVASEPAASSCAPDGSRDQLVVRVAELDGAATSYPLRAGGCAGYAGPIHLSPDGRYAAVAFQRRLDDGRYGALAVAVMDLATGEVVLDQTIVEGSSDRRDATLETSADYLAGSRGAIAGMAWDDERTVRVAWYEVPAEGVHWLTDVIQASTFPVP